MKINFTSAIASIALFIFGTSVFTVQAQAYRRGSLILSISEGSTWANYSTTDLGVPKTKAVTQCLPGTRDPFIIEYGISDRWSVGMTSGNDIFKVSPQTFYGSTRSDLSPAKATTTEFTFDGNYHVFVGQRLDLSVFAAVGLFSMNVKENDRDVNYTHTAKGSMVRFGTRARYYFWRRLGAFGMISSYLASASPNGISGNTLGNTYATRLNGFAIEAGFCYRIVR
ncbi:MAG: hypothetical protein ACXVPQ_13530 [Bacteroidia bacterium]